MTLDAAAEPKPPRAKPWKLLRFAAQAAVSALLVWTVVRRANADVLSQLISTVDWSLWTVGLALSLLVPVVSGERFRGLIARLGAKASLASVLAVNLESTFFNLALPGEIAGGVMRWYRISDAVGGGARAVSVVVVERIFDWAGLATVAAAGAGLLFEGAKSETALRWAVLVCAGLVLLGSGALLAASRSSWLKAAAARRRERATGRWTTRFLDAWSACAELTATPGAFARTAALTVAGISLSLCGSLLMARAVYPGLPILPFAAATCAVVLLSQAPVTVAGVGLREASFPMMLGAWGVTSEAALVLGMNAFAVVLCLALVGGVVHFTGRAVIGAPAAD